ncbi:MAG: rhodanese-like domain-containing protein [Acidobacteriota bacterium]|nr:rhodanese-like domain-containing protein [Acidobacteriota bacterium]
MSDQPKTPDTPGSGRVVVQAVAVVAIGVVLGLGYNAAGLMSEPAFGLPWITEQREVLDLEELVGAGDGSLPVIEEAGQPVAVALDDVVALAGAGAALIVDARDAGTYAEGHIPGAVNLSAEGATPDELEALDSGGRPLVVYCNGEGCDLSSSLAWDLLAAGHSRVAIYEGGYPEWLAAGNVVAHGADPGSASPIAQAPTESFRTDIDDPMGFFGGAGAASLPEIPEVDRPIKMQLGSVKQFYDAGAAVIVDAREPDEYGHGHIRGALSVPLETATPDKLKRFDAGGLPVIVYCGGEPCDVSMDLAYGLIDAGHRKVLVYAGGFTEWEAAGYPVERRN